MKNRAIENKSSLKDLDKAIKAAKENEEKKKTALSQAKANMDDAEYETYRLQCLRDQLYVSSLGENIDWGMVFNYNKDETEIASNYRRSTAEHIGLVFSGHYNPRTKQHVISVEFESDGKHELHEKSKLMELVFSQLILNKDDENRKCVMVRNLLEMDGYETYELAYNHLSNDYSFLSRRFEKVTILQTFNSLAAALTAIQNKSKVAFDIMGADIPLITIEKS